MFLQQKSQQMCISIYNKTFYYIIFICLHCPQFYTSILFILYTVLLIIMKKHWKIFASCITNCWTIISWILHICCQCPILHNIFFSIFVYFVLKAKIQEKKIKRKAKNMYWIDLYLLCLLFFHHMMIFINLYAETKLLFSRKYKITRHSLLPTNATTY